MRKGPNCDLRGTLDPDSLYDLEEHVAYRLFLLRMDSPWIESINSSIERVTSGSALGSGRPVVVTGLPPAVLRISISERYGQSMAEEEVGRMK